MREDEQMYTCYVAVEGRFKLSSAEAMELEHKLAEQMENNTSWPSKPVITVTLLGDSVWEGKKE